jgi:hypothetical protein
VHSCPFKYLIQVDIRIKKNATTITSMKSVVTTVPVHQQKKKKSRNKSFLNAQKNLFRNLTDFALCAKTIIITIIICM